MSDVYVFADESGNFDFRRQPGASKFFILCTVTMQDCSLGNDLLSLRRELAFKGIGPQRYFHASEDQQVVRNEVFALLSGSQLRVDATILEKSKAQPQVRASEVTFYKYAWFLHFKYVSPQIAHASDRLLIVAASLGTKQKRKGLHLAIDDVAFQVNRTLKYATAFWPAETDPCLQIADYCTWAIQRKWESNDVRSYSLISSHLRSEYDIWHIGTTHYY